MKRRISWLHLSDLHFGSQEIDNTTHLVFQALLNDIEAMQQTFDLIFVSGDIAYAGDTHDYELAQSFFSKLLMITGVSKEHLFFVPGNHDIKRNVSVDMTAKTIPQESIDDIDTILSDESFSAAFLSKFENYNEFLTCFSECIDEFQGLSYTRNMEINGASIAVVGFNSAWSSSSHDEKGRIVLGERLVAEAYSRVRQAEIIITLMHHPLHYFRDDDAERAGRIIDSRSNFVLHGHTYESKIETHIATDNTAHYLLSGVSYENDSKKYTYNYTFVDLDANEVQVVLRLFDHQSARWINNSIYSEASDGIVRFKFRNSPDVQNMIQQGLYSKVNVGANKVLFQRGYSIGSERPPKDELFIPGIPKPLLTAIMQKKCFLFIGAGASADAKLPTFFEFVLALVERVKDSFPDMEASKVEEMVSLLERHQLMQLLSYCQDVLGISDFIDTAISQVLVQGKESPTHELLSHIPFVGVISVNYDTFMERYYERNHLHYKVILHDNMATSVDIQSAIPIYKLRGTCEKPESIIVLRRDIVNMLFNNRAYSNKMKEIFSDYTVLFYGFALNDPDIDILLRETMYVSKNLSKKHYALLPDVGTIETQYLLREYNIQAIPYHCIADSHSAAVKFLEKTVSACYLPHFNEDAIDNLYKKEKIAPIAATQNDAIEKPRERRFKVALSFSGEIRLFVESIANKLADRYGKEHILYDRFHRAEFSRPNLDLYLQNLYNTESDLIVAFFCEDYQRKPWCGLEWRAIRDLVNQRVNDERIMYVICGKVKVTDIRHTVDGHFDVPNMSKKDIEELTQGIIERYEGLS